MFALKAAQGDRHAAGVVINIASKTGALTARDDQTSNVPSGPSATAREMPPSERLLGSVDLNLLSAEEQIQLSKHSQRIDLGGDVTVLSDDDFTLLKQIVNKGRGKGALTPDGSGEVG